MASSHSITAAAPQKLIPAVAYARRSTDLQERSIPDQKAFITKWASEHGYQIVRWYIDDAISGTSTRGREDFDRLIDAAENGRDFETILCYDISRFSRGGTNETGYYIHRLKLAGVNVLFPADAIPEGDEGELIQGVKSWQARQYSVKLARDTIRGMVSYVTQRHGAPGGVPPYGYDKQHVTADGKVLRTLRWLPDGQKQELDACGKLLRLLASNESIKKSRSDVIRYVPSTPERVDVVRRIFKMYVAGKGYSGIAHRLNEEGIPSPVGGFWSEPPIRRILQHPCYRGAVVWNRKTEAKIHGVGPDGALRKARSAALNPKEDWIVIEDVHEPIISAKLFNEAQSEQKGRRYLGGLAKTTNRSLLSGLMVCKHCGHNFYQKCMPHNSRAGGGRYRYYADGGYERKGKFACVHTRIPADALDAWVINQVWRVLLGDHRTVEGAVNGFVKTVRARCKPTVQIPSCEKELAAINKRISATVALLADADLSGLDELKKTLVDLKTKRDALKARHDELASNPRPQYTEQELRQWANERFKAVADAKEGHAATEETRKIVHAVVERIEIDPHAKRGVLLLPADAVAVLERETSSSCVSLGDHREGPETSQIYFNGLVTLRGKGADAGSVGHELRRPCQTTSELFNKI